MSDVRQIGSSHLQADIDPRGDRPFTRAGIYLQSRARKFGGASFPLEKSPANLTGLFQAAHSNRLAKTLALPFGVASNDRNFDGTHPPSLFIGLPTTIGDKRR